MNSISLQMTLGLRGKGTGTTSNSALASPISRAINQQFSSTLTAGSKITNGFISASLSVPVASPLTVNLRSFTNLLGETAQSMSKIRFFLIEHATGSAATNIVVGNATDPWVMLTMSAATTTFTLVPGEYIAMGSNSTAGIATSATNKNILVTASGGTATINMYAFGDT